MNKNKYVKGKTMSSKYINIEYFLFILWKEGNNTNSGQENWQKLIENDLATAKRITLEQFMSLLFYIFLLIKYKCLAFQKQI